MNPPCQAGPPLHTTLDCARLSAQADGAGSSSSGSCYTSGAEEGGTDDDDEELSIRVNDLVPPVTRRAAYEMEWEEKPAADEEDALVRSLRDRRGEKRGRGGK